MRSPATGPGPRASSHWALPRRCGLRPRQGPAQQHLGAVRRTLPAGHRSRRQALCGPRTSEGGRHDAELVAGRIPLGEPPGRGAVAESPRPTPIGTRRDRRQPYGSDRLRRRRKAWRAFSEALEQFPSSRSVVYTGPVSSTGRPICCSRTAPVSRRPCSAFPTTT